MPFTEPDARAGAPRIAHDDQRGLDQSEHRRRLLSAGHGPQEDVHRQHARARSRQQHDDIEDANGNDEQQDPGADDGGAQQRQPDAQERPEPGAAVNARRLLQLGAELDHGAGEEARRDRQSARHQSQDHDPQRAVDGQPDEGPEEAEAHDQARDRPRAPGHDVESLAARARRFASRRRRRAAR